VRDHERLNDSSFAAPVGFMSAAGGDWGRAGAAIGGRWPGAAGMAGTLTFPGCVAAIHGCIDSASPGDTILISPGANVTTWFPEGVDHHPHAILQLPDEYEQRLVTFFRTALEK
jgi:hypothetical protein